MVRRTTTLTLQDIADLANVRRPVVSMWRKRPRVAGDIVPFPSSVRILDGVEHFDRDEVVDYLHRTGRGNNSEFDLDAPAGTVPDDVDLEDLVSLLCLRTALGDDLASAGGEQQMVAAYAADPDDRFVVREVLDLQPDSGTLDYIDDLTAASFGPPEALDRVEGSRSARRRATRGLSDRCVDMIASIAETCATRMSEESVSLEYLGGDPALAARVMPKFEHLSVPDGDPDCRALRRRAYVRGLGTTATSGPTVKLSSLVGLGAAEALAALDEVVLELASGQPAVVIGAASVLTDRLAGDQEQQRSAILRSNSLACALRLPRGYWRGAHRQALAVWVCLGAVKADRPMAADLEAFGADELDLDDLSSDVTGALTALTEGGGDPLTAMALRSFRYLRPHRLNDVYSSRTVVPRGIRAERIGAATTHHRDRIIEQTLMTSAPGPTFDVAVADAPPSIVVRPISLGELADAGLRLLRGSRVDMTGADPHGTVEVWSADGPTGVRFDPIEAARHYPNAKRTEPGDVVFESKPRPHAVVDERGGSLVASPARIFRLPDDIPLRPHTLAAAINLLPEGVGDWHAWTVPNLRQEPAGALETALRRAAAYEEEVRRRLEAVRHLQEELITGVAAGAITVEPVTDEVTHEKEIG